MKRLIPDLLQLFDSPEEFPKDLMVSMLAFRQMFIKKELNLPLLTVCLKQIASRDNDHIPMNDIAAVFTGLCQTNKGLAKDLPYRKLACETLKLLVDSVWFDAKLDTEKRARQIC